MHKAWLTSLVVIVPALASAQAVADVPRTPWGDPDVQGIWDNRTITPLERPREFAGQATLTAPEAAVYEALTAARRVNDRYYWDRGTKTVEDRRTALIVDPADGRVPALTPEGQQRVEAGRRQGVNSADERIPPNAASPGRCLGSPVSTTTTSRSCRRRDML